MSDEPRSLDEIHTDLAKILGEQVEVMLPDGMAYVLILFKLPEVDLAAQDLGGGLSSNSSLMVPVVLASTLTTLCTPRTLIALVDGCRENEKEGGTC